MFFAFNTFQVFGTPWSLLKSQNVSYCNMQMVIPKHWNIWCIARGGSVGFYCFLANIFVITLKYLPNIRILRFQVVRFPWENNMLKADGDCRMLLLHKEFFLYIFKCKWNRETGHLLTKISNFVQFNNKKLFLAVLR